MSLGIAFKGPEGVVLAADSRVTLRAEMQRGEERMSLPCTFDNATKLLQIEGQDRIGVVTYGAGAMGEQQPRTAHSFMPEFQEELREKGICEPLRVEKFAEHLSTFFAEHWAALMRKDHAGPDIVFLVGGYDPDAPYGRVYQVNIPSNPTPREQSPEGFGITWGGQLDYTTRLIMGFDPKLPSIVKDFLELTDERAAALKAHLGGALTSAIPYQFLPLQDCVDLSIFLIRTTMEIQTWLVGVRGVGGAIDVATITRTQGFRAVQQKEIVGQYPEVGTLSGRSRWSPRRT